MTRILKDGREGGLNFWNRKEKDESEKGVWLEIESNLVKRGRLFSSHLHFTSCPF